MNLDRKQPIAWALILLGVLALLSGGGLPGAFLGGFSSALRATLLILGGVYLSRRYLQDSGEVWALVLALGLFGAALVAFSSATTILALIGFGCLALYWRDKRRWWAILPAGLFLSLALAVGFGGTLLGTAPLLFLGSAATFVTLLRLGKQWAIYPAIVALVIALLTTNVLSGSLLPLLLIGGGVYLFTNSRSLSSRSSNSASPNPTSSDSVSSSPPQNESNELFLSSKEEVDLQKHPEPRPAVRSAS